MFGLRPCDGKEGGSMSEKRLSFTYKLLRAFGFNYSIEEYGQVSLWRVIKQFFGRYSKEAT